MSQIAFGNNRPLLDAHAVAYANCRVRLRKIPCQTVSTLYPVAWKKDEVTEEKEEQLFEDEEVNSLVILLANLPDEDEFPSQITIEERVESQMDDNSSREIGSALNRGDTVRFRDNPDTGVLELISPDRFTAVIPEVLQPRFYISLPIPR
eukprot:IDg19974t1